MTSLPWNRPICTPGYLLGAKTRSCVLIDWYFLKESNVPTFFAHNMRFSCYSGALFIQINRFQSKGQA